MPTPMPPTDGGDVDAEHILAVEFEYATERRARTVADSIRVETDEVPDNRSRARVGRDGCVVGIDVAATDLIALRAAGNTWLRLVGVAEDVSSAAAGRCEGDRNASSNGADGEADCS